MLLDLLQAYNLSELTFSRLLCMVHWLRSQDRRKPSTVTVCDTCLKKWLKKRTNKNTHTNTKLTRLPVDFPFLQVSSWSAYGPCVAPPGKCSANSGIKTRTRTTTSYPSCGGKACPTLTQTPSCTPVPIPCKVILILLIPFIKLPEVDFES